MASAVTSATRLECSSSRVSPNWASAEEKDDDGEALKRAEEALVPEAPSPTA